MVEYTEILLRLILAIFFGGLIGLEREVVHKPAGIRTHMLVSIGSTLFVIATLQSMPSEIARIMAGIATGIGFLGAGTIFRAKNEVYGLTTAASIWAVAAIGLTVGMGQYLIATTSTSLILIILHCKSLHLNIKVASKTKK